MTEQEIAAMAYVVSRRSAKAMERQPDGTFIVNIHRELSEHDRHEVAVAAHHFFGLLFIELGPMIYGVRKEMVN